MIKQKYIVQSVTNFDCKDWIIHKHYAKRLPPIEYAFGLYADNELHGVVTYATPVSHTLRQLFEPDFKLMELNRLVVNEGLEKNVLSYFVSQSLKMLPKPLVIVSYADSSQNHHGYIYQATNFIYTGLSAKFNDYYIKGIEHLHNGTIMDLVRGKDNKIERLRAKYGADLYMKERARKHRYFYFLGTKSQVKKMNEILPYQIEAYPKGDNVRYDASYKPTMQNKLF